jgi:hypothetical protein
MKPVFQRVIDNEKGDCVSACIASILEWDDWDSSLDANLRAWSKYLTESYGLYLFSSTVGPYPPPRGWCILSVSSALYEGVWHAVVYDGLNDKIAHNPNPQDPRGIKIPRDDWKRFTAICLLDPAKGSGIRSL